MESFDHILRLGTRVDYSTPAQFLEAAVGYFKWAAKYPLQEEQLFHNRGKVVRAKASKVRALTRHGLANHIGITLSRLKSYEARGAAWQEALDFVDQVIYQQKFEYAAAGMLNANLIARDIGLADRTELTGKDGGPLETEDVTKRDAADFTSQLSRLAAARGAADLADQAEPGDEGSA